MVAAGRVQSGPAALRRALAYACGYWREAFGALVALLLVSAANLAVPQLSAWRWTSGWPSGGPTA